MKVFDENKSIFCQFDLLACSKLIKGLEILSSEKFFLASGDFPHLGGFVMQELSDYFFLHLEYNVFLFLFFAGLFFCSSLLDNIKLSQLFQFLFFS